MTEQFDPRPVLHGHVGNVTRDIHGDELAEDVSAAATVLTVLDTADFDETGGVVRIDDGTETGLLRDYLTLSEDPPTLTLATTVGAALPAGTRVDEWDPTAGVAVTTYIADVVDETSGDLVQATVTHSLVSLLEQAVRAGAAESVVCTVDDDGIWTVISVLGRTPVEDGSYLDPDTVPPPAPLAPPAVPVLTDPAVTTAYVAGRVPSARVALSWSSVVTDIDGAAISDVTYEIEERPNGGTWRSRAMTSTLNVTLAPYQPGSVWTFRVRAVRDSADGRPTPGEWSNEVTVTGAADTTPPPAPNAANLQTRLGALVIAWPGTLTSSTPDDLSHIEMHLSTANGFTPSALTLIGTVTAAEALVRTDLSYNVTYYVKLVAIDLWGNRSAASAQSSATIKPLVDTDLIGEVITGANIKPNTINAADKIVGNSITGALIAALAIDAGHLKANAVTADKILAGAVTALKLSADAIDGKTITGAIVRTAATGERVIVRNDGSGGVVEAWTGTTGEIDPTVIDPYLYAGLPGVSIRTGTASANGVAITRRASIQMLTGSNVGDPAYIGLLADRVQLGAPEVTITGVLDATMRDGDIGTGTFAASARPVGEVTMYVGATAPDGWLICNGATFSATTYPALNALLGGNTLPDLRDRLPIGTSSTKSLRATGGSASKTISAANLPAHAHTIPDHTHTVGTRVSSTAGAANPMAGSVQGSASTVNTGASGGGNTGNGPGTSSPIDVMPPWLSLNFIIRAQ